ncbi:hypothetical protein Prudu_74S000300 [Prunus dulcis]|uniref:Uncharacterized protein n=1 Tax=Prunus dulcis TaxID=3755 RepID=A0A5H2XJT0_PRUDU|nr:hypothetical protein Prudu_74S000300 [Prunus dulcis]
MNNHHHPRHLQSEQHIMGRKKVEESSNEASFDIENQATSMENQLTNLRALSPACCIYRVPERLQNVKQKAYTPQVVSIGPLHHGSKNLEAMEDHKLRTLHLPKEKKNGGLQGTPSMTKLHQAGVKFNVGSSKNLFDMQFKKNTLEIPKIEIHDYTELTHRNLIAFEQCHCVDKYISDYVFILDKFVNTPKDVEMLVENRIVCKHASKVAPNHENYYFGDLAGKLNEYCKKTTNRWKANLRQNM